VSTNHKKGGWSLYWNTGAATAIGGQISQKSADHLIGYVK